MSIQYLPHQPIQLYKNSPSDAELLQGQRQWSNTAYHNRLGSCYFIGASYCHPVLNTDYMTFQFKATTTGSELLVTGFDVVMSGNNTSVTTNRLIDSGASFGTLSINQLVENVTNDISAFIEDVTSGTSLLLSEDIFTATPRAYAIYNALVNGNWHYSGTTFSIATAASSEIEFPNIFTAGSWYKVTIKVTDLTAGSLILRTGTTYFATITSVGIHTFYVLADDTSFIVQASSTFVGSWDLFQSSIYQVQQYYTLSIFDLDGVYQAGININADDTNGLQIGNVLISIQWSDFNLACGRYIVGISEGTYCVGEMITNGGFSGVGAGWTFSDGVTVFHNTMDFINVSEDNGGVNTLECSIISGHSYTLSWSVAINQNGDKTGSYGIFIGDSLDVQVSPSYNIAAQSGTITLTFTATEDSDELAFYALSTLDGSFDNVALTDNTPVSLSECDGLSECYCVCGTQDCTTLIKYSSDRNVYGEYADGGAFVYYFRIGGRLRNLTPNDNSFEPFNSTQDSMVQPYIKQQINEEFATQLVPDWVHKTFAVALSHKTVLIDGVQYVRIGAYTPNHKDETELSNCIVNIAQTNQENFTNNY